MDLIEYVTPINDKKKTKGGYIISDFCVRFYYNYIYRNETAHNILSDSLFYDTFIEEDFKKNTVPLCFETIAKQFLIRENKKGKISPLLIDIGTYWYDNPKEKKNWRFDVVGKSIDGYVFFECKFTENPITDKIVQEEIRQVSMTNLKPVKYGFFSKSGFDMTDKDAYLLFTLKDIYR